MATTLPEIGDKPGLATLTLTQGEAWSKVLTITTKTGAMDLTGASVTAAIAETSVACVITSPTEGKLSLTVTDAVSAALAAGEYEGDTCGHHTLLVKITPSGGTQRTLLKITVRVVA